MRNLTASILLALGLTSSAWADTTPATPENQATAQVATPAAESAAAPQQSEQVQAPAEQKTDVQKRDPQKTDESATTGTEIKAVDSVETVTTETVITPAAGGSENVSSGFATDLSVWGMYQNADAVVKSVMVGLVIASVITWALLFSKGAELLMARRRLRKEQLALVEVANLDAAIKIAADFDKQSVSRLLLSEVQSERALSVESTDKDGTKERASFRMERAVAAISRHMGRGNGYLATIGAISPFVGLFGTVWGIMNSFIGIAHSQTTNLAVVAPGIAEALLATALGLVAAIPAVVIYNVFARVISSYRGQVGDMAAQAILLLGRDLDLADSKTEKAKAR
ncbi:tonB-system energizer ExbB [Xenorhabdus szentirmaii]|uniref:Biopolymer transport protein ExbB n=1 Tax=Xenorhabdus szentirmaii DSM 16338 TaxID=1427518 RepID=W1IZT2_9GAMM|nr:MULTISPECIES: tonB-system energizer ExbB [Xenorhabdus]MBD2779570.1 tonB-system energizer ExbB [Xenorhabdus sp. 38]MBD2792267.1 tonB-system energizer ExbB [Xenorhabdus sp. CUL]MBD2826301.1 tonB-system energizer ExbB [Xenorhabdus sp. 5]PHM33803.1 biopolymer transport protein [Xenorhabdus szentirmaii DSM 16338]PHM42542.1 biopolymer transport protein [Xenorhabdus szentirmaii]